MPITSLYKEDMGGKPNFMPGLEPLASGLASKCARFNRHQRQLSLISCNSVKSFGVKKTGKSWTKTKMGERKDIRFEKIRENQLPS